MDIQDILDDLHQALLLKNYTIKGYEHYRIPTKINETFFLNALKYKPDPTDFFVVSYPKCGTTWTNMIMYLIMNDAQLPANGELPHGNFLEFYIGKEGAESLPYPRLIKSHLPYDLVPYNVETKYIYVTRNPFDCCVSFYNHTKGFLSYQYDGPFSEYFNYFLEGKVDGGDYFRHVLSWYGHKDDKNVLFMIYEDMKKNPEKAVTKIGQFMGGDYANKVQNREFVEKVVSLSNFNFMKKLSEETWDNSNKRSDFSFFRKGIVGDYTLYLSKQEIQRLKSKCLEKLGETDLLNVWNDILDKTSVESS
ncbi:Sulfotransferase 1C4 [Nymphon striatum]|nr:Sulfotransferase 1C4 [Nymphon striatum]